MTLPTTSLACIHERLSKSADTKKWPLCFQYLAIKHGLNLCNRPAHSTTRSKQHHLSNLLPSHSCANLTGALYHVYHVAVMNYITTHIGLNRPQCLYLCTLCRLRKEMWDNGSSIVPSLETGYSRQQCVFCHIFLLLWMQTGNKQMYLRHCVLLAHSEYNV